MFNWYWLVIKRFAAKQIQLLNELQICSLKVINKCSFTLNGLIMEHTCMLEYRRSSLGYYHLKYQSNWNNNSVYHQNHSICIDSTWHMSHEIHVHKPQELIKLIPVYNLFAVQIYFDDLKSLRDWPDLEARLDLKLILVLGISTMVTQLLQSIEKCFCFYFWDIDQ